MHKQTFLLGILLVLASVLLIGYNFTIDGPGPGEPGFMEESKSRRNTHIAGMGILLLGGLLIGVSKAMKKAAENGRSLIDEMIDMQGPPTPKSKTKTIVVEGDGNTVESNKKNTNINQTITTSKGNPSQKKDTPLQSNFKELIRINKLEDCFEQLIDYFESTGNRQAKNDVLALDVRHYKNQRLLNTNTGDRESIKIEEAKITEALIFLIDQEVQE